MNEMMLAQRSERADGGATDQQIPQMPPAAESSHRKYALVLVLAVLVTFGPLLLTNQWVWDDWVIVGHARFGDLWAFFKEMGRRDHFMMMQPIAAYGSARDCTAVVLLLCAAVGPLTYTVVRRATRWPAADAFWAALLTVLVPMNQARFVLSTEPYAFSSMFFVAALALLLHDIEKPSVGRRVLILVCLFLAFSTNSFLVLAWIAPALVMLHAWRISEKGARLADRLRAAVRSVALRGELLLAPPAYWLVKKVFQPTSGFYEHYNSFKIDPITALGRAIATLFGLVGKDTTIVLPARPDLLETVIAAAIVAAIFAAIVRAWRIPLQGRSGQSDDRSGFARWIAVIVAFALCVSALFPYMMVGQSPRFYGLWETRHQTTLVVVSGFAIIAIYRLLLPARFLMKAAAVTAIVFLALDLSFVHRFLADMLETRQVGDYFRQHVPPSGTMIYAVENDRTYRTFNRFFAFYELTWLARTVGGSGPVIVQSNQEFINPQSGDFAQTVTPRVITTMVDNCKKLRESPQFGFGGFVSNGRIDTLTLTASRPRPGPFETLYLAVHELGRAEPDPNLPAMVRIDSKTGSIGGACRSPCCEG